MLKVAITGNIASGKSVVQEILETSGFAVFDADIAAHELLDDNSAVLETFADFDILENGKISREKLGKIVFNNKNLLEKLNAIIHPLVRAEIENFFDENSDKNIVFAAVPLLYECGMENMFDRVVLIQTSDSVRLERLIKRSGYSREYALKRLESQMPQDKKAAKADFIINNRGDFGALTRQVSTLVQTLLRLV